MVGTPDKVAVYIYIYIYILQNYMQFNLVSMSLHRIVYAALFTIIGS